MIVDMTAGGYFQYPIRIQPVAIPTPTGQEQVPQDEAHGGCCGCCDKFMRGLGRRLPINFGFFIVVSL
jgi:hypothetical protein